MNPFVHATIRRDRSRPIDLAELLGCSQAAALRSKYREKESEPKSKPKAMEKWNNATDDVPFAFIDVMSSPLRISSWV